ncbi:unnamed protein product [Protopolystoma xenopodis]|uniref:PDZ domain-containing protein n=1 Tax=Protopolystoma xenopodis TaxID=117903 RepID=A0A448WRG4_9PLAT|nr:unnamed protein product [Protopolystoma xenopodis]
MIVSIGPLIPNGAAATSGLVQEGDELVLIDSAYVSGAQHRLVKQILELVGAQQQEVTLGLRRFNRPLPQVVCFTLFGECVVNGAYRLFNYDYLFYFIYTSN